MMILILLVPKVCLLYTSRESARLQSFPDDFIFYGNKSQQYRQVGNAVPPMLGQVVAEKLKQYLKGQDDVE